MNRKHLVLVASLIVSCFPALAEETDPRDRARAILAQEEIRLDDLFRLAELVNPSLIAARQALLAQDGQARQAGLYPNPRLELEVEDLSTIDPESHIEKIKLEQEVILSGRRGNAVEAARARVEAIARTRDSLRRDVLLEIHRLWAQHLYFREADAAFESLLQAGRRTLEIAEARFDARAAPESHVTRARLEVFELETEQRALVRDQAMASARLSAILDGMEVPLDRVAGAWRDAGTDPLVSASDVVADHPAIASANQDVLAAHAAHATAKSARIPDIGLFLAYGRARPTDEEFLEAGVSIPLPLFDRNQGEVASTRARITESEARARMVSNRVRAEYAGALATRVALQEQLTALEERIVPAAERSLTQAQEAYRAGRLAFLELVDAQRVLADARTQGLALRRDLIITEAELMSLTGAGPYAETGDTP